MQVPSASGFPEADFNLGDLLGETPLGQNGFKDFNLLTLINIFLVSSFVSVDFISMLANKASAGKILLSPE